MNTKKINKKMSTRARKVHAGKCKRARVDAGITIKNLAKLMGTSATPIYHVEGANATMLGTYRLYERDLYRALGKKVPPKILADCNGCTPRKKPNRKATSRIDAALKRQPVTMTIKQSEPIHAPEAPISELDGVVLRGVYMVPRDPMVGKLQAIQKQLDSVLLELAGWKQ